jgi:hypothetical protein
MTSYSGADRSNVSSKARLETAALDAVLLLPVVATLLLRRLLRGVVVALIWLLDLMFPLVLQLLRIPLAAIRLLGDGLMLLARGAIACLPVGGPRRDRWRAIALRRWSWIRARLSYRAFEEAVHAAFERGMAWVFRKCRHLTPQKAVLVIGAALLWIPISFGTATALHAYLLANAAILPPWVQLLHPLATLAAKSKLLVLPVYPAAWPQAKKHWFVRGSYSAYAYIAALRPCRRFMALYRIIASAIDEAGLVIWRAVSLRGPERKLPLDGVLRRDGSEPMSSKVRASFDRWAIKFTPEYYELREAEAQK